MFISILGRWYLGKCFQCFSIHTIRMEDHWVIGFFGGLGSTLYCCSQRITLCKNGGDLLFLYVEDRWCSLKPLMFVGKATNFRENCLQSDSTVTSMIVSSYHAFRATVDPRGNVVLQWLFAALKTSEWTLGRHRCHVYFFGSWSNQITQKAAETRGFAMEWSLSVLNDEVRGAFQLWQTFTSLN